MLRLYNTLSRQEEPFAPSQDGTVRMHVCGPTVYARAHIGNFRTYVCVDVLRRDAQAPLRLHRCARRSTTPTSTTRRSPARSRPACRCASTRSSGFSAFREDTEQLGIEAPEETPRATDEANLQRDGRA